MITPAYALTATERVLPRLALDFTTASLDSRVTFTRTGNTATVTNSSGLIAPINANLPRFDFNSITLACKGLLIEEARTNVCTYSSAIGGGTWLFLPSYAAQLNNAVSPDGTTNASNIYTVVSGSPRFTFREFTYTASQVYTLSVFAKSNSKRWLCIYNPSGAGPGAAWFDLVDGVVGSVAAGFTSTITAFGNGYYRCTVTYTAPALGSQYFAMSDVNANLSLTTTANGTSGILVYGAQVELGAFATSYIPTVATTVTRNADVATMTGTNFSSWYNASQGSFAMVADLFSPTSNNSLLEVNGAGGADRLGILTGFPLATNISVFNIQGGVSIASQTAPAANVQFNVCGAFAANSTNISLNAAVTTSNNATAAPMPSVDRLAIGRNGISNSAYMSGHVAKILYWPQKLTSAETRAFSK